MLNAVKKEKKNSSGWKKGIIFISRAKTFTADSRGCVETCTSHFCSAVFVDYSKQCFQRFPATSQETLLISWIEWIELNGVLMCHGMCGAARVGFPFLFSEISLDWFSTQKHAQNSCWLMLSFKWLEHLIQPDAIKLKCLFKYCK